MLTGLVLAGGASTRMGRDKALLEVDGERLVDRAVAVLARCCGSVMVARGARPTLARLGCPQLRDPAAEGPLAGILAGLEAAETPLVAVLAVDMVAASAGVFTALARAWQGEAAVIPVTGGRPQPLHAVWAAAVAPEVRDALLRGQLGVLRFARDARAAFVPLEGDYSRNVNTPADLG